MTCSLSFEAECSLRFLLKLIWWCPIYRQSSLCLFEKLISFLVKLHCLEYWVLVFCKAYFILLGGEGSSLSLLSLAHSCRIGLEWKAKDATSYRDLVSPSISPGLLLYMSWSNLFTQVRFWFSDRDCCWVKWQCFWLMLPAIFRMEYH